MKGVSRIDKFGWAFRAVVAAVLAQLAFGALFAAGAQTGTFGASYINPFPQGDVYRLHLVGDWFADGLHGQVEQALKSNPHVQVQKRVLELRSLRRGDWDKEVADIEERAKTNPIDIAVVMFGAAEIGSVSIPGQRRVRFGSDPWKARYSARLDRVMKALKRSNGAVYWLGLPIVLRARNNAGYQTINEIIRGRAYVNGIKYIDVYKLFSDENDAFSRHGPDLNGKVELLRSRDGTYFTAAGYRKLAHFAVRRITRDLTRARSERNVPLAGGEAEQRRINPAERLKAKAAEAEEKAKKAAARPKVRLGGATSTARRQAPTSGPLRLGSRSRDLKANDGIVEIAAVTRQGPGKLLKLKIVRPPIAAAVIDLVTRKQSGDQPARMGDNLISPLPGGGTLMSSVTPAEPTETFRGQAKLSPTQSPFFKVWAKGERLQPKPGRADDYTWPLPQPVPVVRAVVKPKAPKVGTPRLDVDDGMPPLPEPNPFGAAARRGRN